MKTRTTKMTVTFRHPFVLDSFDEELPAGDYNVETDDELLEGISFAAYRRILTVIHLHPKSGRPGVTEALTIDPSELDAALERDRARTEAIAKSESDRTILKSSEVSGMNAFDRQAIERAESEGMIAHKR